MSEEEKKAIEQIKEAQKRMITPMFLKDVKYNNDDYSKAIETILNLVDNQQKEMKKYKRYFKLAISDLQSEGYMQMPYENIEKYYSKREDIV